MNVPKGLPKAIATEAVIVIAGATLAALVMELFPDFKAWLKKRWS